MSAKRFLAICFIAFVPVENAHSSSKKRSIHSHGEHAGEANERSRWVHDETVTELTQSLVKIYAKVLEPDSLGDRRMEYLRFAMSQATGLIQCWENYYQSIKNLSPGKAFSDETWSESKIVEQLTMSQRPSGSTVGPYTIRSQAVRFLIAHFDRHKDVIYSLIANLKQQGRQADPELVQNLDRIMKSHPQGEPVNKLKYCLNVAQHREMVSLFQMIRPGKFPSYCGKKESP